MRRLPHEIPSAPPISDALTIALRAYGEPQGKKNAVRSEAQARGPSMWALIFDTETTTDESQRPRFGAYQLRYGDDLRERGLFFDPDALSSHEKRLIKSYATLKRLKLITIREFVDSVFVRAAYHWQATTIGFNLPFDLSRLASDHGEARGRMRPGFTFETGTPGRKGPRLRVKHLSRRAALMEFSGRGQRLPRGQRKRKIAAPPRRPAFVDVATLAAALLSRSFSLGGLAKFLGTPHQKLETDEHGKKLTPEYLDYGLQDVQVTWECFIALKRKYTGHDLGETPVHRILSEASLGKAYLRQMSVRPWRKMQANFRRELIGKIFGTYYGGRAEVHQRRVIIQVLYCDFTSMYTTVSTLMGLWPFVIAKSTTWRDATIATRKFLDRITLADLGRPETWQQLRVIVQVAPDGDIFPVRAKYSYSDSPIDSTHAQYTIGLNYLTSDIPLWYTLADCAASKLLTGRSPKILQAVAFEPAEPQEGLRPITIAGNPEFRVDPLKENFFKRIIELRLRSEGEARNVLKLVASSTGYGIFVELNVSERSQYTKMHCYPSTGPQFLVDMDKVEEPGTFFHPLLGALITGAARLMLAIAERLVGNMGLTWAFCDTDSMAIAKPSGMTDAEFFQKAERVRNWFKPLNPYAADIELFKIENANRRIVNGKLTEVLDPLYCFAVSSKRYVLFNIGASGSPVIRKATAHGLGHLLAPYREDDVPADLPAPSIPLEEIGVRRWQHDLWYCIIRAALAGDADRLDLSKLPNFDRPAVSQYAVTTARLSQWFDRLNAGKPYSAQVRPFNFMLMFQPRRLADWSEWRAANGFDGGDSTPPCIIAPYNSAPSEAAARCFDRDSGTPVSPEMLKTYGDALAQYPLRPEAKFQNADYADCGETKRRHVSAAAVVHIGKEANRWEEQSYIGADPEAEVTYGAPAQEREAVLAQITKAADRHGLGPLARFAGVSRQHLGAVLTGDGVPSEKLLTRLGRAIAAVELRAESDNTERQALIGRINEIGIRKLATLARVNPGHLSRIANGKRRLTSLALEKLKRAIASSPA